MRGVEPATEMPSHMVSLYSRGKLTTFWIVFTKIHFCACVVFKKGQQCHPTWQPETHGVNGQRFGSSLPNFISAHAWCSIKATEMPSHMEPETLGINRRRLRTRRVQKGTEMSSHMGTLNSWSKYGTFGNVVTKICLCAFVL